MKKVFSVLISVVLVISSLSFATSAFAGNPDEIIKATPDTDGYCNYYNYDTNGNVVGISNSEKIPKLDIAECNDNELIYNGKNQYPKSISISNSEGNYIYSHKENVIKPKESKKVGKYKLTVEIGGKYYEGSREFSYEILPNVQSQLVLSPQTSGTIKVKSSSKCTYKSSNKKIATVNSNGKVTAKKLGKVTITVTSNGVSSKCTVLVKKPGIYINNKNKFADWNFTCDNGCKNKTKNHFYVYGLYDKPNMYEKLNIAPSTAKVTFSSSDKSLFTVSKSGVLTAKKQGVGVMTVKMTYKNKTYTKKINVCIGRYMPGDD